MKVLIISHNPVSSQSNMGKTFLSLFSGFHSDELCQLYIYPTVPDLETCGSYYRVTDKEALGSLLRPGRIGGEIDRKRISPEQGQFENPVDRAVYRIPGNKSPLRRLLRDSVWRLAPWYHAGLRDWLARQKPACIFVAPGAAKFLYDFALRIAGDLNVPIVTYLCDEFYFVKEPAAPLDRLRLKLLRRKMEELLAASAHLVVISRELASVYHAFARPTTVLMTGAAAIGKKVRKSEEPGEICYFGNIRCNRYRSLGEVAGVLDQMNRELGTDYRLKIYTAEQDGKILDSLRKYRSVELAGYVTGAEFTQAMADAKLLLHVEAFDEASIDRVKHSVSTKIADSLASGVPLLAYGPAEISSMQHLIRQDCALTATTPEQLRSMLLTAFTNPAARLRAAENGLKTARECHDSGAVSEKLRKILERVGNCP